MQLLMKAQWPQGLRVILPIRPDVHSAVNLMITKPKQHDTYLRSNNDTAHYYCFYAYMHAQML